MKVNNRDTSGTLMFLNVFMSVRLCPKCSILNVGFLDPPLHCNNFAAKTVGWFKHKRLVMYTCILKKNLNKIETYFVLPNFIKFAALQPQLTQLRSQPSYIYFTIGKQSLGLLFLVTFQPLCEKITKCYCIASSIHNLFHMVYNEVHDEVNTFTSSSHKEHKITRHTTFSLTCFEEDGLLYTRKPKFSSPDYIFVSLCYVLDS